MIVSYGWFKGRKAELKSNDGIDMVQIDGGDDGNVIFWMKENRIYFSPDDEVDEADLRYVYELLIKHKGS